MSDKGNQAVFFNQYRRKLLLSGTATFGMYLTSTSRLASSEGGDRGDVTLTDTLGAQTGPAAKRASNALTASVVKAINSCNEFCGKLVQKEYVIDCLSERLRNAAKILPSTGDYAEAKIALENASRKLHDLARKNASKKLPRVRMKTKGKKPVTTSRPLIAVKTSSLKQTNQQAIAIVKEAETVLLRATESSERRKVHYKRIATAVGSTKVLLRSS
jgi:hypothetical protein